MTPSDVMPAPAPATDRLEDWTGTIPLAQLKRVLERATADPTYKAMLLAEPRKALAVYGYTWDPEQVRLLFDVEARKAHGNAPLPPEVAAYDSYIKSKFRYRNHLRNTTVASHPAYQQWRERQKARVLLELGAARSDSIIHAPMAFELNKGCSVGCWFCGISAPKLTDIWPYTPENGALWRGVLHAMKEIVGPVVRYGFCYWATDPLDNPDYERFCVDYHDILGIFPQTTTALALRDPARTRALLRLSEERGTQINRFSILTLKKYLEVHETFSDEDLLHVECIPQNNESPLALAKAGKAAENAEKVSAKAAVKPSISEGAGTIACVSGFLFNMVDRIVRLVTPCAASERWPLGYMVLDEGTFADLAELKGILRRMISRMTTSTRQMGVLRFARFLAFTETDEGFELNASMMKFHIHDKDRADFLRQIGRLVAEGRHTADDIALLCEYTVGAPSADTLALLDRLLGRGVFDEEPSGDVPATAPAEVYTSLFDEGAHAPPVTAPAEAYTGLFDDRPMRQAEASRAYHARWMGPSDHALWLSRLQVPKGRRLGDILRAHGVTPRGVLHVGGHYGLELETYIASGFERVAFFEASPLVLPHLRAHVAFWDDWFDALQKTWGLARRPVLEVIECAVSDEAGHIPMHVAELEMLSSLQKPTEPWIRVQDTVQVRRDRLDTLIDENELDLAGFNFLNIDVQGHELHAFRGMPRVLQSVEAVLVELNYRARYEGCAMADEVDAALRAAGLTCLGKGASPDGYVADALYVRHR